jgi:3-deoxy-manno-octulosonate cytidylyltransferase (CMP-KDO synthetase)
LIRYRVWIGKPPRNAERPQPVSVAIILPARLASTRLPNKLLLDRTGKTVLEHTIDRAKEAQAACPGVFTTIRVACDDAQLIAAARRAGAQAVMTRADHQSGTDRIAEAAEGLREEFILNLQADEPEADWEKLKLVADTLQQSTAPMATLAAFIFDEATFKNPNVVKVVFSHYNGTALSFSRAAMPFARDGDAGFHLTASDKAGVTRRVYGYHHIGLYGYRREFLQKYVSLKPSPLEKIEKLEQMRALEHGFAIKVAIVENHVPGIDTQEDYDAFCERMKAKGK